MARPSDFTPEIAAEICGRLIESDFGLEQICQSDDLPSARTVYRWLEDREEFRQQYARAKVAQGHVQAERALRDALKAEDAAKGRLAFDARKWAASKLAPRQYGEKLELSGDADNPVAVQVIERRIVRPMFAEVPTEPRPDTETDS